MVTNTLSMAEHIHGIISSCSQTLHALRILRSHGMPDGTLFEIFHGVVIAKLSYAANTFFSINWFGHSVLENQIQELSKTFRHKFKDFQGPCLFSRTFQALKIWKKIQELSRTRKSPESSGMH